MRQDSAHDPNPAALAASGPDLTGAVLPIHHRRAWRSPEMAWFWKSRSALRWWRRDLTVIITSRAERA